MDIPASVQKSASHLIDRYGGGIEYLGEYDGQDAFLYEPGSEVNLGYPFVYLHKDGKVMEINDPLSLDIISSLS